MLVSIVLVTSEPIVVSDNDPDLDINWWIQDLFLNQRDREVLQTGKELTDNIINAAQTLLSEQYPNLKGFQSTCLGHHLDFKPISRGILSVQILHTGLYTIIASEVAVYKVKFCDLQGALSIGCVYHAVVME